MNILKITHGFGNFWGVNWLRQKYFWLLKFYLQEYWGGARIEVLNEKKINLELLLEHELIDFWTVRWDYKENVVYKILSLDWSYVRLVLFVMLFGR